MNQEIITKEVERTPEDRMVVHLFQEGSFYRAYEWSAWLAHRFIKDFKVTQEGSRYRYHCPTNTKILELLLSHYKSKALRTNLMYSDALLLLL